MSIYLKFLSINFRIEKNLFFNIIKNLLINNIFVEKQSQIRLSLDEFKTLNYSSITNLNFTKNQFD